MIFYSVFWLSSQDGPSLCFDKITGSFIRPGKLQTFFKDPKWLHSQICLRSREVKWTPRGHAHKDVRSWLSCFFNVRRSGARERLHNHEAWHWPLFAADAISPINTTTVGTTCLILVAIAAEVTSSVLDAGNCGAERRAITGTFGPTSSDIAVTTFHVTNYCVAVGCLGVANPFVVAPILGSQGWQLPLVSV